LLTCLSLQLRCYEVDLDRHRTEVAYLERELDRLRGLEDPELRLKRNRLEFIRDQARLLHERCKKLRNQKNVLTDYVRVLGEVAELILGYTLAMSNKREVYEINVARLGAVSQLMFDMSLLMEKSLVEE
jgi:hypothetical protein